jgi:hypothetical protein
MMCRVSCALTAIVSTALPSVAQQQIPGPVSIAWNRYYDSAEIDGIMDELVRAYPTLLTIETIGTSAQGRPLRVMTLNNPKTGAAEAKPAMWIDGNIHGNELQASETVLYSIDALCRAHGKVKPLTELVDECAFYFLPSVNPDGRAAWFSMQSSPHAFRTGLVPTDNDRDGAFDEDGPDDLDGDKSIGQMWRRDRFGTHRRNQRDPRVLEAVPREPRPDGTIEYGDWSYAGSEGIDNDGDGQVNEDGPGGYDMNRNWPCDWQPDHIQGGAGDMPLSYPETRAVAEWILRHPNIAAAQSYHNAGGMILRGPGASYRTGEYSGSDRAVYDSIAAAGAEMMPFYTPMQIYKDLYTVHGGFVSWMAESRGVISFTDELWSDRRILQNGSDPTPEQMIRWRDRLLFGQTVTDWSELPHPEFGTVLVGGPNKWSSRLPPPFMLEEEAHRNFAFTAFHAGQMPKVVFRSVDVKSLGRDTWAVTVEIANDRRIPTRTARAAACMIGMPDTLTWKPHSADGPTVVAAGPVPDRLKPDFEPVPAEPSRIRVESGISGLDVRAFRFLVRGNPGQTATLRFEGEKFKAIETTVQLPKSP